jgi:hypothetical protein
MFPHNIPHDTALDNFSTSGERYLIKSLTEGQPLIYVKISIKNETMPVSIWFIRAGWRVAGKTGLKGIISMPIV